MKWSTFSPISKEEIKAQISKDLKGKSYDEIIWNHPSGIGIEPYLNLESDIKPIILNLPSQDWSIIQRVNLTDIRMAQSEALLALQHGVNALYFDFADVKGPIDFDVLFDGILLEHIQIHLRNINEVNQTSLEAYIAKKGYAQTHCFGSSDCLQANRDYFKNKRMHIKEGLDFASIANQFYSLIQDLNRDIHADDQYFFEVELGSEFFIEVAKMRALRLLWDGITSKFKLNTTATMLAITSATNIKLEDGHTNILRATTEAMSAIIGNCDGLLIHPHDLNDRNHASMRISKNIQLLLKEESGFNFMTDPGNGAYYIDQLTHHIAENIWNRIP
ncbi:MAG: hypothetical protein IPK03_04400 [Bacteroidetes bacterium]|nr:hypothetical protein [Bacteroidota bacterium]